MTVKNIGLAMALGFLLSTQTAFAEADWIRSEQRNAEAVSPVIQGPQKLYVHINCGVEKHNWSYTVFQIPATGPTSVAGQQIGDEMTFGGANDPFVRDAVIDIPLDSAKAYRLKIVPKNGGNAKPAISPLLFTEREPRGAKALRRFNVTFLDHNSSVQTWIDIHVLPRK